MAEMSKEGRDQNISKSRAMTSRLDAGRVCEAVQHYQIGEEDRQVNESGGKDFVGSYVER